MRKLISLMLCALMLLPGLALMEEAWQRPYDKALGATYVAFGRYPQSAEGEEAPIAWRVLETVDGHTYLVSEYILDVSKLHHVANGYPGWAKADLNAWLQTEFIEKAFTLEEKAALMDIGEGLASIPSTDDLKNLAFGMDSDLTRRTVGTPYANSEGLYYYRNYGHNPYWTRTPSTHAHAHRTVKEKGNLGYLGVTNHDMGIRPVIWLKAELVEVLSGTGSLQDPFVLGIKAP